MLAWVTWQLVTQSDAIQRGFWEMLRIYDDAEMTGDYGPEMNANGRK